MKNKNPNSNQIIPLWHITMMQVRRNKRLLERIEGKKPLNPYYVTGFADGESSFIVIIRKEPRVKTGWRLEVRFSICLHKRDLALLELIKFSLGGVGNIANQGKDGILYQVTSLQDLTNVIIPHFDKYPLITQKKADFELFKRVVDIMNRKGHLSSEGLQEIVNIRASLNLGLSDVLKAAFPNTNLAARPLVVDQEIKEPNWLSGFASGEGCFFIDIAKSSSHKAGFRAQLKFQITQHSRDKQLMKSLVSYLGVGQYYPHSSREAGDFVVRGLSDITEKIIPFFDKYPIVGAKALDYADFRKVSELMKVKAHLTKDGLDLIRKIKIIS